MSHRYLLAALLALAALLSPLGAAARSVADPPDPAVLYFWAEGCLHCAAAKLTLAELAQRHPDLEIRSFEVRGVGQSAPVCRDGHRIRDRTDRRPRLLPGHPTLDWFLPSSSHPACSSGRCPGVLAQDVLTRAPTSFPRRFAAAA